MRYIILTKKRILTFGLFAAIGIIILALSVNIATSSSVNANTGRKLPVYFTQQDEKLASISFDAAWGNEDTEQLISILQKYNVKATFFLVGDWVDRFPDSTKALSDAGHEIANHSDTHPHMPKLSAEQMTKEIVACNDKIEKITKKRPTVFRAPYGEYSNSLIESLAAQKMLCIQWDVETNELLLL